MKVNVQVLLKDASAVSTPLMLVCYHKAFKSGRFKYYLLSIAVKSWDIKKQKSKERWLNDRLQWIKTETEVLITRQLLTDQAILSNDWLKVKIDALLGKQPTQPKQVKEDFFSIWERIILQTKVNNKPITNSTVRSKKNTMFRVKDFAKDTGWKASFKNIDKQFHNDFTAFLQKRGVTSISKYFKDIKATLREAEEYGYEVNQAFKGKSFRVIKEKPKDSVYLNEEEIQKLIKLELPQHLANVRDTFVMACYCGLRHSDWKQIHPDNILMIEGRDFLSLRPQKTGNPVRIPVHPIIKEILSKHNGHPTRILSNQKSNKYIKEIAKKAELGKVILGGKISDKYLHITSHSGRRSFATNSYLAGLNLNIIMALTGHKSEASFKAYLKLGDRERERLAADSAFFGEAKMKVSE